MQSIEHSHKSVVVTREIFRCSNTEMDVRKLLLVGVAIRCLDGSRMQIKSTELRFRERLRHDEGGDAMTASDVRNKSSGAQLLLDAVKCGYPLLVYVGLITGPKEPLYPAKKAVVMLSPRSEEHTSELQSHSDLVCRLLLEKKKIDWTVLSHARRNRFLLIQLYRCCERL